MTVTMNTATVFLKGNNAMRATTLFGSISQPTAITVDYPKFSPTTTVYPLKETLSKRLTSERIVRAEGRA
ncbi:MAG: hypothetical protein COY19_09780 [Candidatus Marinimicrobia bacterium CG_4_10_14_0_2_um_filter_48_9]|nr:MAG: hypothetical protein COY19_09780 [Candidatus Marinimicrobia bacterium CG_4_10_14_0_2_um_filter_48_9]